MSGGVWFTSDLHFGHRLVAGHRGFDSVDEHDAAIVENWKRHVGPSDHVWVLGDIAVSSPTYALSVIADLPGEKHLISGNHDGCHPMHRDAHKRIRSYLDIFASVSPAARRRIEGSEVLLSHFPYGRDRGEVRYTQWRLRDEGRWLLHGHTHGPEKRTGREIHVGLDAWNLKPVNLGTIADLIREESA